MGFALGQAARDLFGRAEQLLQPGEVERQGIDRGVFNARRNGQTQVQQRSVRRRFLRARAMPNRERRDLGCLDPGHAEFDSGSAGLGVHRHDPAQRRRAFDNRDRQRAQIRFVAHHGFEGKVGNVNAGIHRKLSVIS